jgi:hypothetical protein
MSPCFVLLGAVPVFGEDSFAEEHGLGGMTKRLVFQHGDERAAGRRQMDAFKQSDNAMLINYRFMRLDHVSSLSDPISRASTEENKGYLQHTQYARSEQVPLIGQSDLKKEHI